MTEQLEAGRRTARRRWAALSFYFLLGSGVLSVAALVFSPARMEVAEALSVAAAPLGVVFTTLTAICLGYLGVSGVEAYRRNGG